MPFGRDRQVVLRCCLMEAIVPYLLRMRRVSRPRCVRSTKWLRGRDGCKSLGSLRDRSKKSGMTLLLLQRFRKVRLSVLFKVLRKSHYVFCRPEKWLVQPEVFQKVEGRFGLWWHLQSHGMVPTTPPQTLASTRFRPHRLHLRSPSSFQQYEA